MFKDKGGVCSATLYSTPESDSGNYLVK